MRGGDQSSAQAGSDHQQGGSDQRAAEPSSGHWVSKVLKIQSAEVPGQSRREPSVLGSGIRIATINAAIDMAVTYQ
jgi:hypothetical protein